MQIRPVFRKIRARLIKSSPLPPESQRQLAVLPAEGAAVSVEKALNSRCTSDYDDDTALGHWGMFDKTKKLSEDQIGRIISSAKAPRLSGHTCEMRAEKNIVHFIVDQRAQGIERDWLMIESGMQQQAVQLVGAASGVGAVFKSVGPGGTQISDSEFCTMTMRLDPMKPSYQGSFWSTSAPVSECGWRQGNLPDPCRDGGRQPLLTAFEKLAGSFKTADRAILPEVLGQLLWAAKGRTPHFYKSIPWGMTIPTWNGKIEVTSVYACNEQGLFKYINWDKNRPTHSLRTVAESDRQCFKTLKDFGTDAKSFLVFKVNAPYAAALWEIGYSLISTILQMKALAVSYSVLYLEPQQKKLLGAPLNDASAVIGIG